MVAYISQTHVELTFGHLRAPAFETHCPEVNSALNDGGAKETRKIDRRTYYDFPRAHATVKRLQPNAIIFSDGGPGCRWVGNENGYAHATNWSLLRINEVYPGYERYPELQQGHADGDTWVPAECNVSIRPGWFYHEKEDDKVKSVDHLTDLYYRSVGHNGTFLINFPVDREGLIHPIDSARAVDYHQRVAAELKTNLLQGAKVSASDTRDKQYAVKALTDGLYDPYWATHDSEHTATLTFRFKKNTPVNRMLLQEYIPLGQRVEAFTVEYLQGKEWLPVRMKEETTTIGYKRLLRFQTIQTRALRVRITKARGPLCLSEAGAYYAPNAQESYEESKAELKGLSYTLAGSTDPRTATLDLGQRRTVSSLHYQPAANGVATHYEMHVYFTPTDGRYVQLRAVQMLNEGEALKYDQLIVQ